MNSLGWGVPRSVIAVSRFSIAKSADRRTLKALPRRPDRAAAEDPSKCTSPAKARVAEPPPDRFPAGAGEDDGAAVAVRDFAAVLRLPAEGAAAPASGAGCAAHALSPRASAHSPPATAGRIPDGGRRSVNRGARTPAF